MTCDEDVDRSLALEIACLPSALTITGITHSEKFAIQQVQDHTISNLHRLQTL